MKFLWCDIQDWLFAITGQFPPACSDFLYMPLVHIHTTGAAINNKQRENYSQILQVKTVVR